VRELATPTTLGRFADHHVPLAPTEAIAVSGRIDDHLRDVCRKIGFVSRA
jgi:hypothetical protein